MSNSKITDNMIFAGSASRFKGLVMEPVNKDGYCDFEFQTTEKNLKIKKIISGGAYRYIYNCLWTEDNKIYFQHSNPEYAYGLPLFCYLKQYFTILDKNDENFYEINFNQILLDFNNIVNIEIKDIIGNANGLFIWLNNNYLFYLNLNENNIKQIESEQSKIITAFGTGNMSSRYIFKDDKRNTLYWDDSSLQKVEINESETDKNEPILFGCCYDNNNIIVTMENKLYCKKYDTELFQYKASKFEKESKVIDLKCGYDHTVFLLENQSIYAFGFNSLHQSGIFENESDVLEPTKLTIPLKIPILSIGCTSRGTCIVCKDEIIFIGELVEKEVNFTKRIQQ